MNRPPAQPVTVYVPEVFITVSVDDVRSVVAELRRYARDELRGERLLVADMLEQTIAGERGTQRLVVSDLPQDEQAALLRAVEHLRWGNEDMSEELGRLHFALKGWVPQPQISYEVVFDYRVNTLPFTSYTGRYEVGDRLPPRKQDECWEVIAVEPAPEASNQERLIVERCRDRG
jgi:hypothetical protein